MSKARANADATSQAYIENATATQNLSGTYSTERLYFNDSYTLTGDVTVTGHLALGSIADEDIIITQDGTERTITGEGTLKVGELMNERQTSLTGMTGELASAVTGSPNLNLSNASLFPAGHIIKVTTHVSANALSTSAAGLVAEADANDITVTCVAGNKLNITIMGGSCLSLGTTEGWYSIGMRIVDSGTTDVHISGLYNRALNDYKNDGMPCVMYTHTATTTSVTIKRFIEAHAAFDAAWYINETSGVRYLIMEEQV